MIQKEGVDELDLAELQQACRARGMRAYGLSAERLRFQLSQWLDLSLNKKVPPSLLFLSRAFMLPETIPTSDKLKATISALPKTVVCIQNLFFFICLLNLIISVDNKKLLLELRASCKRTT